MHFEGQNSHFDPDVDECYHFEFFISWLKLLSRNRQWRSVGTQLYDKTDDYNFTILTFYIYI